MGAPPRGVVVRNFPGQYTYRSVYCITMNITLKVEDALRTKAKAGCAFINASLEINRPGHPVREAALAHLRAREGLVHQLLTEAGVEDADLAAQVTLLVDGAYAVGGSRRDPAAARHAKAAVAALLASRVVS